MDRPDARSPLVLDTRKLGRRPGTMQELQRTVVLPEDLGTEVIAIKAGSPVEIDVRLESVVEGVLVTGSVSGLATGACVRCLDPVELDVDARFQELFAYTDRAAHHHEVAGDSDEDDVYELVDDLVERVRTEPMDGDVGARAIDERERAGVVGALPTQEVGGPADRDEELGLGDRELPWRRSARRRGYSPGSSDRWTRGGARTVSARRAGAAVAWRTSAAMRVLPDFLVIGAQKAGTSWWNRLIEAHPDVVNAGGQAKELHFFDRAWETPFSEAELRRYEAYFPAPPGKRASYSSGWGCSPARRRYSQSSGRSWRSRAARSGPSAGPR